MNEMDDIFLALSLCNAGRLENGLPPLSTLAGSRLSHWIAVARRARELLRHEKPIVSAIPTAEEIEKICYSWCCASPSGCANSAHESGKSIRALIASRVVTVPSADTAAIIREAKREAMKDCLRCAIAYGNELTVRGIRIFIAALDPKCEHKNVAHDYKSDSPNRWVFFCMDCNAKAEAIPGKWKEAAK